MVLEYSITVFLTQLIFIGCRTWNIQAISNDNIPAALLSGAIVHITWLLSISIGTVSMIAVIHEFNWHYIPVILCSLSGGLIGMYWAMDRGTIKPRK